MLNGLTISQINEEYPIAGLTAYSRVLVIRRFSRFPSKVTLRQHQKGRIERLSGRSRSNFLLSVLRSQVTWKSLMTLTYGPNFPRDGRQVKSDWNAFITSFRRSFGPVRYFWFLEFQSRGAPHFHAGFDIGPPKQPDRAIMADIWSRVAEKYDYPYSPIRAVKGQFKGAKETTTRTAVRKVHSYPTAWDEIYQADGAIHYVAKYATKTRQKEVPKDYQDVGRFWALSRNCPQEEGLTVGGDENQVREVLESLGRNFDGWEMLPRVIFF